MICFSANWLKGWNTISMRTLDSLYPFSESQFRLRGARKICLESWPDESYAGKPGSQSEIKRISNVFIPVISHSPFLSLSKCKGFTSISEDSSEISFLLVENYNYDHSLWSSDRMGIFGQYIALAFWQDFIFSLLAVLYGCL